MMTCMAPATTAHGWLQAQMTARQVPKGTTCRQGRQAGRQARGCRGARRACAPPTPGYLRFATVPPMGAAGFSRLPHASFSPTPSMRYVVNRQPLPYDRGCAREGRPLDP